ncbi:twisted gastrulation protein homolog 1-A-like [Ischnura elegans]|uniref:twisted gastrulation protein homolog 1-A-like n=1 Tax=Ischnura elegans TaxID=197161 RepID=UPI001ED8A507|nr:twisted gastrulation protein homolog 1-A-like [Ischnura elegans]XP_046387156.1 twisted gastrulation protein homolog 1-A-like [Ischnura elegans]
MGTESGKSVVPHVLIGSFLATIIIVLCSPSVVEGCNEAVCASVVSKCMLTQSCKCDLKNCSCCKECFNCLSYLYSECCSCVDMCPKPNNTNGGTSGTLGHKSHVEPYQDDMPELFQVLMSEPDPQQRWVSYTYAVEFELSPYFRPKLPEKEMKLKTHAAEQDVTSPEKKDVATINCTVAFMSQCMSWNKCKTSCQSTGASSYRWFHDGCCQCVGHTCINYGLTESRCLDCPISKSKKDFGDEPDDDAANYAYDNYEDDVSDERRDSDLE